MQEGQRFLKVLSPVCLVPESHVLCNLPKLASEKFQVSDVFHLASI